MDAELLKKNEAEFDDAAGVPVDEDDEAFPAENEPKLNEGVALLFVLVLEFALEAPPKKKDCGEAAGEGEGD